MSNIKFSELATTKLTGSSDYIPIARDNGDTTFDNYIISSNDLMISSSYACKATSASYVCSSSFSTCSLTASYACNANPNVTAFGLFITGSTSDSTLRRDNNNSVSGNYSTVGGGGYNIANGDGSVVAGGCNNISNCLNSAVGGGYYNTVCSGANNSAIVGGQGNTVTGMCSFIGGGYQNMVNGSTGTIALQYIDIPL